MAHNSYTMSTCGLSDICTPSAPGPEALNIRQTTFVHGITITCTHTYAYACIVLWQREKFSNQSCKM